MRRLVIVIVFALSCGAPQEPGTQLCAIESALTVCPSAQKLERIEAATGRKPIIYTAAFMGGHIGNGFASYPLWVANYGATCPLMPANWTHYVAWQYTSTGGVPGVPSTNVDHDIWNGDVASLE